MKTYSSYMKNDTFNKDFTPIGNKVIKLARTNYFSNILKDKNIRFIGKSVLLKRNNNEIFNSRNNFYNTSQLRSLVTISNHYPKKNMKIEDTYFINEKRYNSSKACENSANKITINKTVPKNNNFSRKNVVTAMSSKESSFHSTFFHTEIPIIKKINFSDLKLHTNSKDKLKVFFISRKNLNKFGKASQIKIEQRANIKQVDLAKVFFNKNTIMQKNKLPISKLKELKIELMIDERKNKKILDELAKIRIQSNEYLKYFHSKFDREKKRKTQ